MTASPTPRPRRLLVIAAALGVTAAGALAAVLPGSDDIAVTAVFADASPLYPGNTVRASGVTVGEVESVDLVDGRAHVRMRLEDSVLPLHTDARATITEQDLLGERFIALEKGSTAAPALDSRTATIPESNTSRTVDLQSILNGVDDPTGTALASLVTTLGEGTNGRGADIAGAVRALEPTMNRAQDLSRLLDDQNELLTRLVDTTEPVLGAIAADDGRALDGLVGSADRSLGVVAHNQAAVKAALERAPATLASAQATLARVAGVADKTTPTLAAMRPVTQNLTDVSGELHRFADAADPALASLQPVLDEGQRLIDEAAPVAEALRPAGQDIRTTAAGGREFVLTGASGPAFGDLMEFVKNWALTTNGYDGLGHYFRVAETAGPKALGQTAAGAVPGGPVAPIPPVPQPTLPNPAPLGPAPEPDHPARTPDAHGSATGMDEEQETSMMDQLLGGG